MATGVTRPLSGEQIEVANILGSLLAAKWHREQHQDHQDCLSKSTSADAPA
jgi:hypothetical protein